MMEAVMTTTVILIARLKTIHQLPYKDSLDLGIIFMIMMRSMTNNILTSPHLVK